VRIAREQAHNRWHPALEPVTTVAPGDEVTFACTDGIGGQLDRDSTHADVGRLDLGAAHPLTGPVFVEGAAPGTTLEIEFLAYEPDDFGTTAVIPGFGFLADLFSEPYLVKWEIAEGVARSEELPGVVIPQDMFAGVVGVAPSAERLAGFLKRERELLERGQPVADSMPGSAFPPAAAEGARTVPPRETGGNMDVRQLVAGAKLWLPVDVHGALFSIGDLHFAQGDGEVCGTAIEVAGSVTVRFAVHDVPAPAFPAYESPGGRRVERSFATMGIPVDAGMDLNAATRAALLEMIGHLERRYGFERPAAYALCSACVDLCISEVVDVPYPLVSALLPLDVFEGDTAGV
jgi:formamidase